MSLFTFNKSAEDQVMDDAEQAIIDAEFTVLTESNEQCAIDESGLHKLFLNWAHLEDQN